MTGQMENGAPLPFSTIQQDRNRSTRIQHRASGRGDGGEKMKRPLRFSTPREVRESLTKVANEVRTGQLAPQLANSIAYIANVILGSIRVDEQERRIVEMEQVIERLENEVGR